MKKKFTFLMAALMLLTMILPWNAVGQTRTDAAYLTLSFPDDNYESNGVGSYTVEWTAIIDDFSWTINNFNNNSWNNSWSFIKCGQKKNASTGIITTGSSIDRPVKSVTIDINTMSTTSSINSIILYTKTASTSWTSAGSFTIGTGEKSVTIASPTADLLYKIEASCASGSNGVCVINSVKYNVETYTVTYDCNEGTSGCPSSSIVAFVGSYTLASAPIRDGYSFQGWNDGANTYAAGASYTISSAVTFTAQWQSLESPNIVINGGAALALENTASEAQTATIVYNNMSGYSSPSVALFNDSECTSPFTAG
ncbi:MAG: InlB B-repeat-containing protein [Bacteroidales bacterium]|nr:InlB B-repeat-containing protein [Bacteroidales bacterium]